MTYTTLNARVKQKINTEAQWIAEEDEFGVIFEGEQAFVYNDEGEPVNFKIGDGTKKFSELPYFIAYYTGVTSQKILAYIDQTANLVIPSIFKNLTLLQDLIFINNSGAPIDLKIGTTDGAFDVAEITIPNGAVTIGLKKQFQTAETLYFTGLTGLSYSLFILYFQLNESPAIPPTSSGGLGGFAYGTLYPFYPMYPGHDVASFDFSSGTGKPGTPYDGCLIMGTNDTDDLEDTYLVGYGAGDTIGGDKGTNELSLVLANIPKLVVDLPYNSNDVRGGTGIKFTGTANSTNRLDIKGFGGVAMNLTVVPVNNRPKSKSVLLFTGPPTT